MLSPCTLAAKYGSIAVVGCHTNQLTWDKLKSLLCFWVAAQIYHTYHICAICRFIKVGSINSHRQNKVMSVLGKNFLHSYFELHGVEWLHDIVDGANLQQSDALARTVLAAEHDDGDVLEQLVLLYPLKEVVAPHAWHTDVGDDEVGGIA